MQQKSMEPLGCARRETSVGLIARFIFDEKCQARRPRETKKRENVSRDPEWRRKKTRFLDNCAEPAAARR